MITYWIGGLLRISWVVWRPQPRTVLPLLVEYTWHFVAISIAALISEWTLLSSSLKKCQKSQIGEGNQNRAWALMLSTDCFFLEMTYIPSIFTFLKVFNEHWLCFLFGLPVQHVLCSILFMQKIFDFQVKQLVEVRPRLEPCLTWGVCPLPWLMELGLAGPVAVWLHSKLSFHCLIIISAQLHSI